MQFFQLFDVALVEAYLRQCRVRNTLVESDTHVPPTPEETKMLMDYLSDLGLKPAIVGSVGILHHLGPDIDPANDFRPTVDLDVWVPRVPPPPPGWSRDMESIGTHSWISPSGGYVDFIEAGHAFPDGYVNPSRIEYDQPSLSGPYPVAAALTILKMKLSSLRAKDLSDSIALVRKMGRVPSAGELGKLTSTQKENMEMLQQWFKHRPHGKYGE